MKIAFLVKALYALGNPANGVVAQAKNQAQALTELGHEVTLLNPWEWRDAEEFDVVHFFFGGPGLAGVEKLARSNPNRALVFSPILDTNDSNARYRFAAALGGIVPKLYTIQGEYRKQALASDVVICRSRFEQLRVVGGLGVPASRTAIVLNGVSVPEIGVSGASPTGRLASIADLKEDFVLHVGAYTSERKNAIRLVEAVGPLGIPLIIAGWAQECPILDKLKSLSRRYREVRLLGLLSDGELHALYSRCRVFCLPSLHEGTGLVALEAAAYGANVVVTKNGAPPDYFGPYAEYVDPLNVEDIRQAVDRAWRKPKEGVLRERVVGELTWHHSARALSRVYEQALIKKLRG